MLCSTKWGCSNRPVGGAQGTSQQQKWAKPRTASSVVLLSHSSLGLPLRTGLEGEDRPLPMNWYHQLKSHFHHGGHAACQLLWDKFDRRLRNKKGTRSICVHLHVWAHMSFFICVRVKLTVEWAFPRPPQGQPIQLASRRRSKITKRSKVRRSIAFVPFHHTCADRQLIWTANVVNNWACFVTVILSADTVITAQVMKERPP